MKTFGGACGLLVLVQLLLLGTLPGPAATAGESSLDESHGATISRQAIESDWLRQDVVRRLPPAAPYRPEKAALVTTQQDAAGAVDGVKDGTYGFHTSRDENPWWQVDLGDATPLDRIVVYNRCDGNVDGRAARLKVLLSTDANTWTELYQHDGTRFLGQPDGKPLCVRAGGARARFVRLQLPGTKYFHLDEVEVYRMAEGIPGLAEGDSPIFAARKSGQSPARKPGQSPSGASAGGENVALGKPADQSSTSQWSKPRATGIMPVPPVAVSAEPEPSEAPEAEPTYPTAELIASGLKLAADLRRLGANVEPEADSLREVARRLNDLADDAPGKKVSGTFCAKHPLGRSGKKFLTPFSPATTRRELYFNARWAIRRMALANPLLDFDDLLFVKRVPGTFTHMSDQYYGWFSRPGGGLYVLENFKSDEPRLRCLTPELPPGSILRPDLSYDATKVLFAYCKHYPGLKDEPDKLNKANVPEDAFYHLYEMQLDGTGLRRLTRGKYDDFDGRYLPDGRIVFLSTRRGQHVQCGPASSEASADGQLPDCYVRCGGGPSRPVAVYTLHVMNPDGTGLAQISPFEMFEWTPSIDYQGRILYARWDYVDRHNMPYMSLWSTMPDGTGAQAVFGNFTTNPHCIFEARSIPNSQKLIFTASGHHAFTGGSLVLLDPHRAPDGEAAMRRLTPEVVFPEAEGWPQTYFANPYPLSEEHYLVAWSASRLPPGTPRPDWGMPGEPNDLGLYLFDAFGNLNLLYRDPAISSMYPLPIRPRPKPPVVSPRMDWAGSQEGRMLLANVYEGLGSVERGSVRRLRLVGIPQKTHPTMNFPSIGLTRDDPGKFVIGTVPVEEDGSAYFHVPSGVSFFLQALDSEGMAVQTMRSATYVQPGQTYTCIGCHEPRNTSPANSFPIAMSRAPSKINPGPEGSWPLDFQSLVGPVLEAHCTDCHKPGAEGAEFDLTPEKSYDSLVNFGKPSLREHVLARYAQGRSVAGACASTQSPLVTLLKKNHYDVKLQPDEPLHLDGYLRPAPRLLQRRSRAPPGRPQTPHEAAPGGVSR